MITPLITGLCALVAAATGTRPAISQERKNRTKYATSLSVIFITPVFLALSFLTGCGSGSSSTKTTTTQTVAIAATSGSGQSAAVTAAFAAPLVATVTTNGTPTSGVTVTFTAPSSGASGTFAGGTKTAVTNASGVATSAVFAAGTTLGAYKVTATAPGATTAASFSLTNTVGAPATVTATSGFGQSVLVSTAFPNPLVATVVDSHSNPVSGVVVTFTAPTSGASGTFAGGANTATTNASGVATSAVLTANSTGGGPYNVVASVTGATSANFALTNTTTAVETIMATPGSQSAAVGTAFASPLVATVTTGGTPNSNVVVTFIAPSSGASGTFAGGTNIVTATTNASGVATSAPFTANTSAGGPYMVVASAPGANSANFSLTNNAGPAATITPTGGSPQTVAVATAFASPLTATVFDSYSNPVSGAVVTFTAPGSHGSGTFADTGNNVTTATTNASGVATSTVLTANTTSGEYSVVASAGAASANFALTNANNYVFYLSGADNLNTVNPHNLTNYLAVAGVATIDPTGNVIGGEEDYNDANSAYGVGASFTPITGGTLSVDGTTGLGTLTLITGNSKIGMSGTETFAIAFVNSNHARVMQFDGFATSSGSLDLQTPLSTLSGGYSFIMSGVDAGTHPIAFGGVFSVSSSSSSSSSSSGTAITSGVVDFNDNGYKGTDIPFNTSAALSQVETFGRGMISNPFPTPTVTLAYYIVNQEAIRIIDIDKTDAAIGSVFSQGAATFTNASLGNSVLAIAGNPDQSEYGAVGQFSTSNTSSDPAMFSGVGEANEMDNGVATGLQSAFSGTYSFSSTSNGYGSMSSIAGLGSTTALGIYATDPMLNLNDPNNKPTTGGGGELVLDLSAVASGSLAGGTGVLIPQTDTTPGNFTGNYVAGWQNFNTFTLCNSCEFDMLAQGSMVANGALSLTGDISDPFQTWSPNTTSMGNVFSGTPAADGANPGRYSMWGGNTPPNLLMVTPAGKFASFALVMYQANAGQLYWLDFDTSIPISRVFVGDLEQQGDISAVPSTKKPVVKTQAKQKR